MTWSLVTYRAAGGGAVGLREPDGTVRALPQFTGRSLVDLLERWSTTADELRAIDVADLPRAGDVRLEAPIRFPRKVVCAGANYFAHLAEMNVPRPDPVGAPYFFLKPPTTTVIGPDDPIVLPDRPDRRIDWEAELGVVIGRRGRDLDEPGRARAHRGLHHRQRRLGAGSARQVGRRRPAVRVRLDLRQGGGHLLPDGPGRDPGLVRRRPAGPADHVERQRSGETRLQHRGHDEQRLRGRRGGEPDHDAASRATSWRPAARRVSAPRAGSSSNPATTSSIEIGELGRLRNPVRAAGARRLDATTAGSHEPRLRRQGRLRHRRRGWDRPLQRPRVRRAAERRSWSATCVDPTDTARGGRTPGRQGHGGAARRRRRRRRAAPPSTRPRARSGGSTSRTTTPGPSRWRRSPISPKPTGTASSPST